jgi:hypothetical protein
MRDDVVVLMTAYRRPGYLRKVLTSWRQVRGIEDVQIVLALEPSDRQGAMLGVIRDSVEAGLNIKLRVNDGVLGVDVNIVEAASRLWWERQSLEYMIFAEDDLVVSSDTLEYFLWADREFRDREDVLLVNAHTDDGAAEGSPEDEVYLGQRLRCWVWATWRDRWDDVLKPTWDRDVSSWEYPGDPCDWAWNLDLRVIPRGGFRTVLPAASRSENIGRFEGVHADPGLFQGTKNPSFRASREPVEYRLTHEEEVLPVGWRKHRDGRVTPPQSP